MAMRGFSAFRFGSLPFLFDDAPAPSATVRWSTMTVRIYYVTLKSANEYSIIRYCDLSIRILSIFVRHKIIEKAPNANIT